MFEEAFEIHKKFNKKVEAIKVLVDNLKDIKRANEFASKVDEAPVWSELGHAQLREGLVAESISSYLRANDSSNYAEVGEGRSSLMPSPSPTPAPPPSLLAGHHSSPIPCPDDD